jgi:ADP-ribose pyrophosphatase
MTSRTYTHLGELAALPAVTGGDDASRAAWITADSYAFTETALRIDYGGTVFAAHAGMLRRFLAVAP